ncbi:MAG TPA: ribosome small subunit-dependent GTPase A [Bacteroidales bacterium]|nr:ribosome small subunit-dependent GTPase A [Bacteroidales bacterium]
METGIVIKSVGSRYKVLTGNDNIIDCVLRGRLREKEVQTTNPVAVGDNVTIDPGDDNNTGIITGILKRKNYILRKASNLSKQSQIIAANIDQLLLIATIILPATPVEFIDRFLVTAEAYRIPARIIFNKTDLYEEAELERMEYLISVYSQIGYICLRLSIEEGTGLEEVALMMKDRVSLISGNSGVGKTTLLNLLNPRLNLKTAEISDYHKQGKHITTFPEMHSLPFGGFAIDTPGLRGFGVVDMERNEIYHFFPEIFKVSKDCRFYNCLHLDEPECAVRQAVEQGAIDPLRYRSYLSILNDENTKYR